MPQTTEAMKNRLTVNILIDIAMLAAMSVLSASGFILEVILPPRHAIRHDGVQAYASQLCGMGRHDWGDIHLWAGVTLVILLVLHIALHWKMVDAFFKKKDIGTPARGLLYAVMALLLLLIFVPWLFLLF